MSAHPLDSGQSAAVAAPLGGVFIAAGAGTGKTRVLTERFVRLLGELEDDPRPLERLAAITFTEKAAGELAERIRGSLAAAGKTAAARRVEDAWIGTIHGTCARLLRRHAFEAGLDPAFAVLDRIEQGSLAHEAFARAVAGSPEGWELVVAYGAEGLERQLLRIAERTRTLGAGRPSVATGPSADPTRAVLDAAEGLESVLRRLELCAASACAKGNAVRIEALIGALREWREPDDAEALLRGPVGGFTQGRRASAEVKSLADEAEAIRDELAEALAEGAARRYGEAFIALLAGFEREYEDAKAEAGAVDFGDLQTRALRLLADHPGLGAEYRARFAEMMVDEFQDTDRSQVQVVEGLAGAAVSTVGDERQSIYAFRDADVEVFRERRARTAPERVHGLATNYRSRPEVIEFVNELFSRDPFWAGGHDRLACGVPPGDWPDGEPRVRVILVDKAARAGEERTRLEAAAVAEAFARLRDSGAADPGGMAVLLRTMGRAAVFAEELEARGFGVLLGSGATYFETAEAAQLEALVRLLGNSSDDEAAVRFLAGPLVGASDDALALVAARARGAGTDEPLSMWSAVRDPGGCGLAGEEAERVSAAVEAVEAARVRVGRLPLSRLLLDVCERIDADLAVAASGDARAWANVLKFVRIAGELERTMPGDPAGLVAHLRERRVFGSGETEAPMSAAAGTVLVTSVHSAKGLEFPVVAVAELGRDLVRGCGADDFVLSVRDGELVLVVALPREDGVRPEAGASRKQIEAAEDARDREEEQRILYVACTRAREALILSGLTDLAKEPDPATAIGLVRQALGIGPGAEAGDVTVGGAAARVEIAEAPEPCARAAAPGRRVDAERIAEALARDPVAADGEGEGARQEPERVSYSGLAAHAACAYRYRLERVLGLGGLRPGTSGRAADLGSAFHRLAAEHAPGVPEPDEISASARAAGLDGDSEARLAAACRALESSEAVREAATAERVMREAPFALMVGETVLDGSLDLIGWQGRRALVVDYKTGLRAPSERTLEHYALQASCYALAALRAGAEQACARFVLVEQGCNTVDFEFDVGDEPGIASDIAARIEAIASGRFDPLAEYSPDTCPGCPGLGGLCPVSAPDAG